MSVGYTHAKAGYRFTLTEKGLEEARVRAKFEVTSPLYKQYQHYAPKAWIEKGYVTEVEDGEE